MLFRYVSWLPVVLVVSLLFVQPVAAQQARATNQNQPTVDLSNLGPLERAEKERSMAQPDPASFKTSAASVQAAAGETATGTIGPETFDRRFLVTTDNGCNATSNDSSNDGVLYDVIEIYTANPAGELLIAEVNAAGTTIDDTVLFLYCDEFDPTQPTNGLVAWDDDGGVGFRSAFTAGDGIQIEAGRTYAVVITGFNNTQSGDYSITFGGDIKIGEASTEPPQGSFSILESDGSSAVMEGGMTDQLTVSMGGITNSASLSVTSSDPSQLMVSPSTLNFNTANADASQTVTLTAIDDALLDGTQTATVTFSVNIGASDSQFSQLPNQTVTVSVADNEMAGFLVTESGGTTTVSEGGPGDSFEVALSVEPVSDVTIKLMSSDAGQATVSPMMLTFSPGSATQPQTVTVTAVDDASVDGEQTVTITASVDATTSDAAFANVSGQSVSVTVSDNDTAGYSISQSGGTTSVTETGTGSEDTFTISLDVAPEAGTSVTLNLMSSDTEEATVSPSSLTFSAGGTTSETVTITGVNDNLPDGDQTITVTVSVDGSSTDNRFTSLPDQVVTVQVLGANNAPTARDDAATVAEDGSTVIPVLVNDEDPDGSTLSITSHTNTAHGALTQSGTSFTYTPAANFHGTDSFTYTIDDGHGGTSEATVTITVTPVPDAPVAEDDFFDVTTGVPMKLDVLGNDSDADGDPLALRILPSALVTINMTAIDDNGTPDDLTDDTILFTPRDEFVGFDRFTYEVRDASGLTSQAQAYVLVSKPVGSRAEPTTIVSAVEAATAAARQAQRLQEQAPRERLIEGVVVRAHDAVLTVQQGAEGTAVQLPTAWTNELAVQTDLRVSDFFAVGQQVTVTGLAVEGSDAVEAYTVAQGAITDLPTAQAVTLAELQEAHTHTLITISDLQWSDARAGVGSTLEGGRSYAVSDAEGHTARLYVPESSALVGATISDSRVTFTGIAVTDEEADGAYQLVALLEDDVVFGDAVAETAEVPVVFELEANYPNPFNPQTQIRFGLPEASEVVLTVYDVRGREVATLVRGSLEAGRHQVSFSGQGLASGLYFYRITAGSFEATRSMLLLK